MPSYAGSGHSTRGPLIFTAVVGVLLVVLLQAVVPKSAPARATATVTPTATSSDRAAYLGPSAKPPLPAELHSKWVSQTANPTLRVGETARVSLTFKNTGTEHWVKGTASEIHLGVKGDSKAFADMAVGWLSPTRPAAQTEGEVLPDARATFTFTVKGARPGTFRIPLQPVCDGVAWLEDDGVFVVVTVR